MIVYKRRGRGLVNRLLNKLPIELHLPGYQFCGPGTKLTKRLARGDPGINPLDVACKEHDIVYSQNRENIEARNAADRVLADKAWKRVVSKDSGIKEKAAAFAVTSAMKLKSKFGMGVPFRKIVKAASKSVVPSKSARKVILSALKGARKAVKDAGGKRNIGIPRILPVPSKVGGFLPFLIPLFAGLSATGAIAGGAAGIAKAVNDAKSAKQALEESQRHNRKMEDIALGKGLYLKPHKTGLGLRLKSGLRKKKSSTK